MRHFILAGALALACLRPALADDTCKPLQMVTSVPLEMDGGEPVAPITVNGQPSKAIISTGAGITGFSSKGADKLGLHPIQAAAIRMLSGSGKASHSYLGIDDFALGTIHVKQGQFMLLPDEVDPSGEISGLIGGDLLSKYDVEMDFAGGKLNFFLQDHCPGKVIYWQHQAVAMVPFAEQAATPNNSRTGFIGYVYRAAEMWVPVTLDGKQMQARISTAGRSTIDQNFAYGQFGITASSPGATPVETGVPGDKAFRYRFSTLVFDGVTVTNPTFTVHDDKTGKRDPENSVRTDTRLNKVDDNYAPKLVIGIDVLRRLHLFASFGEHRLYMTEASAPLKALPASASLPAGGTLSAH